MKNILSITQMIELSTVRSHHSEVNVLQLVNDVKEYQYDVNQPLPTNTPLARELPPKGQIILVRENLGFPSGGHSTTKKGVENK